jgi:hypothetical protein
MKDFDLLTGNSFKNFTVVSPFMTRIAQQLIQQLREVAENFSNKEIEGADRRLPESTGRRKSDQR